MLIIDEEAGIELIGVYNLEKSFRKMSFPANDEFEIFDRARNYKEKFDLEVFRTGIQFSKLKYDDLEPLFIYAGNYHRWKDRPASLEKLFRLGTTDFIQSQCKLDTVWTIRYTWVEVVRISLFRTEMQRLKIDMASLTLLDMWRSFLLTKEKMNNYYKRKLNIKNQVCQIGLLDIETKKVWKKSVHEDIDSFVKNIKMGSVQENRIVTHFLPKLREVFKLMLAR